MGSPLWLGSVRAIVAALPVAILTGPSSFITRHADS